MKNLWHDSCAGQWRTTHLYVVLLEVAQVGQLDLMVVVDNGRLIRHAQLAFVILFKAGHIRDVQFHKAVPVGLIEFSQINGEVRGGTTLAGGGSRTGGGAAALVAGPGNDRQN